MSKQRARIIAAASLVGALAIGPALAASAADGSWGPTLSLSGVGMRGEAPTVVTDGSTITAAWIAYDGSTWRVQASTSTDAGASWSTPQFLSQPAGSANAVSLVTDGSTITAAWNRFDGSFSRIQASSSTDGGTTWSAPVNVSSAGINSVNPTLITDGTTITAVWEEWETVSYNVVTASSADGGATWSSPFTLNAGSNAYAPHIDTNGTVIVAAWHQPDPANPRIFVSTSLDQGATWSSPHPVSGASSQSREPHIVVDDSSITLAWEQDDATEYRIYASSSTDGGATWAPPAAVSSATNSANTVMLASDGTAVTAVWHQYDVSTWHVYLSSSVDGGVTWDAPLRLSGTGDGHGYPHAARAGDLIAVVWEADDGDDGQIAATTSTDGGATWDATQTLSAPGETSASPRVVVGDDTFTAVWYRGLGGPDSFAQTSSITLEDAPGPGPDPDPDPDPDPGTGDGEGGLAATGTDESATLAIVAFGLVLVAAGMMLVARRRAGDARAS